jgi:uncharacterized membrane protein YgcG
MTPASGEAHFYAPPLNCWIVLALAILGVTWLVLAGRYWKRGEKCPNWLVPDWIFGDATCDPMTAPLTIPAKFAIAGGGIIGFAIAVTLIEGGLHWKVPDDAIGMAFVGGVGALCAWWGVRGARVGARWVMVRRANPIEVFIAGAAGALVCVWFHTGAGSSNESSSSSSSSSSDDRSSGGGRFGGGGASGSW